MYPKSELVDKGSNVNPTPDHDAVMAASRLINARVRGFHSGAEKRDIARVSRDPALRQAALIMDAFCVAEGKQAGDPPSSAGTTDAGVGASPAAPALGEAANGAGNPANSLPVDRREVAIGPRPRSAATPRPSYASMALANRRRHGCDGQFIPRGFARQADAIGDQIRKAREAAERDGAA